jgi:predicted RNA-binding protein with PUA-like domain
MAAEFRLNGPYRSLHRVPEPGRYPHSSVPTFLLKTEPGVYSFSDLVRDRRTTWDGVSNPAALIHIRQIHPGDDLLIYHTGDEKAIVGLARAASAAFEDPKHPGKTPKGEPKAAVVELTPIAPAKSPLTLADVKADEKLGGVTGFDLVRLPRLSVMPVPPAVDKLIRKRAGLPAS